MAIAKYILLHIQALPALILGFLYAGFTFCTFMSHRFTLDWPSLTLQGHWRPWLMKLTGGRIPSFTLGTAFMLNTADHIAHEKVHVRQYQDVAVQGFWLAVPFTLFTLDPIVLLAWPGMLLTMLTYYLSAWLRGSKDLIRESEHEASAYAQTR